MSGDLSHVEAVREACVIGHPIGHSRSPLIHGYWLEQHGIAGAYGKRDVPHAELFSFVDDIRQGRLLGCNVTVPHKVAVMDLVDHVSPVARAIGAANTLWCADDGVHATNTDVSGFMAHLEVSAPQWRADAGPAVVIGAGGAARAIVYGLREAGVPYIRVINRTLAKAEALRDDFGDRVTPVVFDAVQEALSDARLVVNTSSLGMIGQPELAIDLSPVPTGGVVVDIVYAPLETALLRQARQRGLVAVDGLGMLLHQAVPGFELWFGIRPTVSPELRSMIVATLETD